MATFFGFAIAVDVSSTRRSASLVMQPPCPPAMLASATVRRAVGWTRRIGQAALEFAATAATQAKRCTTFEDDERIAADEWMHLAHTCEVDDRGTMDAREL